MFLLLNKQTLQTTVQESNRTIAEATGADSYDVHWQLKRTGRWDSEDQVWVAIPATPENED